MIGFLCSHLEIDVTVRIKGTIISSAVGIGETNFRRMEAGCDGFLGNPGETNVRRHELLVSSVTLGRRTSKDRACFLSDCRETNVGVINFSVTLGRRTS